MEEKNKKSPVSHNATALGGEVEELNKQLQEATAKRDEYLNGWKRERADFLNYKKEEMERIGKMVKYANEEVILKIIPILDNFCLAEKHITKSEESAGFMQIKKQLEDFLEKEGIKHIEVINHRFDLNTMEAVEGDGEKVLEEVMRGYTMHGKLIRPAKVKVAK